jgi:hypothetical protein
MYYSNFKALIYQSLIPVAVLAFSSDHFESDRKKQKGTAMIATKTVVTELFETLKEVFQSGTISSEEMVREIQVEGPEKDLFDWSAIAIPEIPENDFVEMDIVRLKYDLNPDEIFVEDALLSLEFSPDPSYFANYWMEKTLQPSILNNLMDIELLGFPELAFSPDQMATELFLEAHELDFAFLNQVHARNKAMENLSKKFNENVVFKMTLPHLEIDLMDKDSEVRKRIESSGTINEVDFIVLKPKGKEREILVFWDAEMKSLEYVAIIKDKEAAVFGQKGKKEHEVLFLVLSIGELILVGQIHGDLQITEKS